MTNEYLPTWLLEAGDVIRVRHQHDSECGACLAPWETEAVVTATPAAVPGRVVVSWAAVPRFPGGQPRATTGVSVFSPDEQVLRLGRAGQETAQRFISSGEVLIARPAGEGSRRSHDREREPKGRSDRQRGSGRQPDLQPPAS
jgi:hypothetical protein